MTAAAIAIVASWRLLSPPEPADVGSEILARTDSDFIGIFIIAHPIRIFRAIPAALTLSRNQSAPPI